MPTSDEILTAIPSTEPCTFTEFLNGLPDVPERGHSSEWAELFDQLRAAENAGLIEIERTGKNIESLMLTAEGAEAVRRVQR